MFPPSYLFKYKARDIINQIEQKEGKVHSAKKGKTQKKYIAGYETPNIKLTVRCGVYWVYCLLLVCSGGGYAVQRGP